MSRCGVCRKSSFRCNCRSASTTVVDRRKKADKGGVPRRQDKSGNQWCSRCTCLVRGGKCANVTCSTNKG